MLMLLFLLQEESDLRLGPRDLISQISECSAVPTRLVNLFPDQPEALLLTCRGDPGLKLDHEVYITKMNSIRLNNCYKPRQP
jgi:hypothetical protein